MRAWSDPDLSTLPAPGPAISLYDTASRSVVETSPATVARLYVCGITPYDATHLGHAATYVAFDLLVRGWRNAGHRVHYVQNVTDIDDPLLERADKIDMDWQKLAERETELFREDMAFLRVIPPTNYVGAVESIPLVIELISRLEAGGAIYRVDTDLYFSVTHDPAFGQVSGWDRDAMLGAYADRGGDPGRAGKRDPLDCVVWRGQRRGEPSWPSPFGAGRPGWHIECAAIADDYLGLGFDVQGGGSDLVFPHHEMSAGESQVAHPDSRFAKTYVHAGMVAYDGEKMSKSKGNLVFVSALRHAEVDPMAIRLVLLRHHYRSDWEWTDDELWDAARTLDSWRKALSLGAGAPATPVVTSVLAALADDLDAPTALAAVQQWCDATLATRGLADHDDPGAAAAIEAVLDAALGLSL